MDFEELYREFYPQVYAYLLKLSGDEAVAEELTQDTFFKIFKKIGEFRGDCKFSVWACRIAKNGYCSYLKKQRRIGELPAELPGEDGDFEARFADRELSIKVHEALHRVPEPYREVFWMRVFGELSFEEIAKLHGKSESWARVTFHRAKIKVREIIEVSK